MAGFNGASLGFAQTCRNQSIEKEPFLDASGNARREESLAPAAFVDTGKKRPLARIFT
jgi:hypothetical protein